MKEPVPGGVLGGRGRAPLGSAGVPCVRTTQCGPRGRFQVQLGWLSLAPQSPSPCWQAAPLRYGDSESALSHGRRFFLPQKQKNRLSSVTGRDVRGATSRWLSGSLSPTSHCPAHGAESEVHPLGSIAVSVVLMGSPNPHITRGKFVLLLLCP